MEFLYECLCDGQLEELITFLRGFEQFEFLVSSTGTGQSSALTSNTVKDIAYEIKNNSLCCPVHGCKITLSEMNVLFKNDCMNYTKNKKRKKNH